VKPLPKPRKKQKQNKNFGQVEGLTSCPFFGLHCYAFGYALTSGFIFWVFAKERFTPTAHAAEFATSVKEAQKQIRPVNSELNKHLSVRLKPNESLNLSIRSFRLLNRQNNPKC
jgi:hypothetical protein